jgi:hypothetical protein
MSIRGSVTLECDSKGCHAEQVIDAIDSNLCGETKCLLVELVAPDWVMNNDGDLRCPQCVESAREQVEKDAEIRACGGYEAWKSL